MRRRIILVFKGNKHKISDETRKDTSHFVHHSQVYIFTYLSILSVGEKKLDKQKTGRRILSNI